MPTKQIGGKKQSSETQSQPSPTSQPAPETTSERGPTEAPRGPAIAESQAAQVPSQPKVVKVGATFMQTMAELMYMDSSRKVDGAPKFDTLPAEEIEKWEGYATSALLSIDRMNKQIVPRVAPETVAANDKGNIERLTKIIEDFVKMLKVYKKNPESFPARELAMRIFNPKSSGV